MNTDLDLDFTELELLAQMPIDSTVQETLALQTPTYGDATLDEIFEHLESAVETYSALATTLAPQTKASAEQEIEFFYSLIQERLSMLLSQSTLERFSSHLNGAMDVQMMAA